MNAKPIQGGAIASINGRKIEDLIRNILGLVGLRREKDFGINSMMTHTNMLFDDGSIGVYSEQCEIPLVSPAHRGKNRRSKIDFVLMNQSKDFVLLSVKSQQSDGSAEQKLWHEIQDLIDTELPSAMFVYGPIKGNRSTGWSREFLESTWDRTKYHGKNVFLFRDLDRLEKWLRDGFPTPGNGRRFSDLFEKYCNLTP